MNFPSAASWRAQRDLLILSVAAPLSVYEVVLGGGRPAVLTFLTTLLLSPIAIRLDEARKSRERNGDTSP